MCYKEKNSIDYTKKRDEISTKIYLRGNNGFPDGVGIDVMLPESVPNQYFHMKYNNEHHNLFRAMVTFQYQTTHMFQH